MHDRADGTESETAFEPVDELVLGYLADAGGDTLLALRRAAADLLRVAVDARLTEIELRRAASAGFLRTPPDRQAA